MNGRQTVDVERTTQDAGARAITTASDRPAARRVSVAAVTVLVLGLALTGLISWTTYRQYQDAETRLLLVQTRQAGEVLVASVPGTQLPLATATQLAATSGGSPRTFLHYMDGFVGTPAGFLAASLWTIHRDHLVEVAGLGPTRARGLAGPFMRMLTHEAFKTTSFVVRLVQSHPRRLVFVNARRSPTGGYVVLAERALPANGRARVASNAAFADLRYAIYIGRHPSALTLLAGTLADPGAQQTAMVHVPFGTASLTIVTAATGPLAGDLPARRPWLMLAFGAVLSLAAAALVQRIVGRRRLAEADAQEISTLNNALADLYAEQRTIALTLQRSLLPASTPVMDGVQFAVRYLPGAAGAEIGGDWYSVLSLDGDRFGFVVGDVSGRGVRAAAVMAALRFTVRALLLEGHDPDEVLERTADQTDDIVGGQLATVLVGVGSVSAKTVRLASAGHLPPLRLDGSAASYVDVKAGVPIGAPGGTYTCTEVPTQEGTTLLAFTDGLVERRGRAIGVELERLRVEAQRAPADLEAFVTALCDQFTVGAEDDDVAVLAIRWGDTGS